MGWREFCYDRWWASKIIGTLVWIVSSAGMKKESRKKRLSSIALFKEKDCLLQTYSDSFIERDMLISELATGISYPEYFLFDFVHKNQGGKREYIGKGAKTKLSKKVNSASEWKLLNDKYLTYKAFAPFFQRQVILVSSDGERTNFDKFVEKFDEFMVKPVDLSCGKGIFKVDKKGSDKDVGSMYADILCNGDCILEECIKQSDQIAKFHESSVNTVRIVTYYDGGIVHKLYSLFRIGIGGSVVDNAGAGGLIANIDLETGIITTPGFRENGELYLIHPDSGTQIVGSIIPQWNELLDMVEKLAKVVPTGKLVGWDLALGDNGWIMVEANPAPAFTGVQMCQRKGLRKKLEKLAII